MYDCNDVFKLLVPSTSPQQCMTVMMYLNIKWMFYFYLFTFLLQFSDMLLNDSSAICTEGFWDSVVTSGNLTAVYKILELICSLNETSVLQEAMSAFLNSHLFSQQVCQFHLSVNFKICCEWLQR